MYHFIPPGRLLKSELGNRVPASVDHLHDPAAEASHVLDNQYKGQKMGCPPKGLPSSISQMRPQLLPIRFGTSKPVLALSFLLCSVCSALPAHAQVVGGPNTVRYRAGVIASICTITATDGELGASTNRSLISSSAAELPGGFFGNPTSAAVAVTSNMGATATLIATTPTLIGPTAAATSQLRLGTLPFATTSTQNLAADGSLNTTLDVRFDAPAGGFNNGTYTATAVVTCNQ